MANTFPPKYAISWNLLINPLIEGLLQNNNTMKSDIESIGKHIN